MSKDDYTLEYLIETFSEHHEKCVKNFIYTLNTLVGAKSPYIEAIVEKITIRDS